MELKAVHSFRCKSMLQPLFRRFFHDSMETVIDTVGLICLSLFNTPQTILIHFYTYIDWKHGLMHRRTIFYHSQKSIQWFRIWAELQRNFMMFLLKLKSICKHSIQLVEAISILNGINFLSDRNHRELMRQWPLWKKPSI